MEKGKTWNVLDKGYVKYIDSMGSDELIVETARMSTGRGFISWEPYKRCDKCDVVGDIGMTAVGFGGCEGGEEHQWKSFPRGDMGFLEYIYSHRHATPFESPELMIEFKAPIVVLWQWVRHRTQSYNIESGRYIQLADEHYVPSPDRFKKQSTVNKQDSALEVFDPEVAALFIDMLQREQESNYENYDVMVQGGVANELSRLNAPMSRYTRARAKTDLRNWLSFLLLRLQSRHSNPQWEIAEYAKVVAEIIKHLYPRTYEMFEEHTLHAETFSRTEMNLIRQVFNKLTMEAGQGKFHAMPPGFDKRIYQSVVTKMKE